LLGEKDFVDQPIGMSGMPDRNVRDSYPKWNEWDQKIAELQKQLDALDKSTINPSARP
jgi:hypothetical protein